jgi:hypothetical protein
VDKCPPQLVESVWSRGETFTKFWWGNLRERDHWRDPGLKEMIILKRIFIEWVVGYGLD